MIVTSSSVGVVVVVVVSFAREATAGHANAAAGMQMRPSPDSSDWHRRVC